MPPVAILYYIFQWDTLFQAANNTSIDAVTFLEYHKDKGLDSENNAT